MSRIRGWKKLGKDSWINDSRRETVGRMIVGIMPHRQFGYYEDTTGRRSKTLEKARKRLIEWMRKHPKG